MAAGNAPLNGPPPLPDNLQPKQSSLSQLAGSQASATPGGSGSLQQAAIEKIMFIEQAFKELGTMIPGAAPVIQSLTDTMRAQLGKVVAQAAQPQPAPPQGNGFTAGPPPAVSAQGA